MIEANYPWGDAFQQKLLALLLREPDKMLGVIETHFFTNPIQADIAKIIRGALSKHQTEPVSLSKVTLKELVRASLGRKDEDWPLYRIEIRKLYETELKDREVLSDQAMEFARDVKYREALVQAEKHVNARKYEDVHKAIDALRLTEGSHPDRPGGVNLPVFDFHQLLAADFQTSQDYLVETIIPRGGAILSYGLPKGLKSWFSAAVAIDAAIGDGRAVGYFNVPRPVRVLLVQVEDSASRTKSRLQKLKEARLFRQNPNPGNLKIITRCPLNLTDSHWLARLEAVIAKQKTELVIFDVLRRLFRGDVNSAEDTAAFLEQVDGLRDKHGLAAWIVHHSNKRSEGEMMTKALGSINLTAWPDVLLYFKHKQESNGITTCNLEMETKDEAVEGELKVILGNEEEPLLRIEKAMPAEDKLRKAMAQLKVKWTIDDLAGVLALKYSGAYKVLQEWLRQGIAALASPGSKGHRARYRFVQIGAE